MKLDLTRRCLRHCVTQGIVALYPAYGHNGENITLVCLTTSKLEINCGITTVLNELAHCYDKTLHHMRRTASSVTGYYQYHPLYYCRTLLLIPVKHRKSFGRRDGSMAYINVNFIKEVIGTTQHATINFLCELPPYACPFARASTVRNKLVLADTLITHYKQLGA